MAIIQLTRGFETLVDDDLFPGLSRFKWHVLISSRGIPYARLSAGTHRQTNRPLMHRFIMKPDDGVQVDHISGDSLDNRRANLRFCTNAQNSANRRRLASNPSGYKGVYCTPHGFTASICANYKSRYLGSFRDPREAARAYDLAAKELHGEFARLNFPEAA